MERDYLVPTTTNNGWTTPADTDLIRNGASAIRTLASGIDSTVGGWTLYTPTVGTEGGSTNWALGNGNATGRYQNVAGNINFELRFGIGSTTTKGNGVLLLSLPTSANTYIEPNFYTGVFYDDSTTTYYPIFARIQSNQAKCYVLNGSTLSGLTGTVPVTVATSDYIIINGSYAAA